MTTGEKLVEMSTLTIGSALDHFLNISYGSGGGSSPGDCDTVVFRPAVTPGPVLVIEELVLDLEMMENTIEFTVEPDVHEMDIDLQVEPNTLKFSIEWL